MKNIINQPCYNTGIDLGDFEETFEEVKRKLEDKQKSERECI